MLGTTRINILLIKNNLIVNVNKDIKNAAISVIIRLVEYDGEVSYPFKFIYYSVFNFLIDLREVYIYNITAIR